MVSLLFLRDVRFCFKNSKSHKCRKLKNILCIIIASLQYPHVEMLEFYPEWKINCFTKG